MVNKFLPPNDLDAHGFQPSFVFMGFCGYRKSVDAQTYEQRKNKEVLIATRYSYHFWFNLWFWHFHLKWQNVRNPE